jgi:uncharacterized coiled-coil protein SlyX
MSTCNSCEENSAEETSPKCCQYDANQVIYRLNSFELSELSYLGIGRGDSLEYIIEKLGKHILDFNPNFVESFGYQQKTLPELFEFILNGLAVMDERITEQDEIISTINDKLIALTERVDNIETPQILDSKGVGFTKLDKINTVIQKIVDNGL